MPIRAREEPRLDSRTGFAGQIIETGATSYRLAHAHRQRGSG
jgi:hypothetical protein